MAEVSYSRYAFRVDGLSFANYMRGKLEQRLAEKGELPPGVTLDVAEAFRAEGERFRGLSFATIAGAGANG